MSEETFAVKKTILKNSISSGFLNIYLKYKLKIKTETK